MQLSNPLKDLRFSFRINKTQVLGLYFLVFFVLSALLLFYPIKEIFQGHAKLEQQFGIPLPSFLSFLGGSFGQVINIRFYALCILTGVLSGYALTLRFARLHRIAGSVIDRLLLGLTVFGLVGARAFYVLFNLDAFLPDPISILFVWLGGLAIFGAILFSIIYVFIYTSRFKFSFFEFLDLLTPGLILGQIFGRFGNFFNYESYGSATSVYWKMFVPQTAKISDNINQDYFHPTFLYEVIPNIFLFLLILFVYEKLTYKRTGLIFGMYAVGYGLIRFCTEFFRLDALTYKLPFTINISLIQTDTLYVSQIAAATLFIIGIMIIVSRKNKLITAQTAR
jgi:phosphatidylglycerol---prolipoprotein diacylglyceryl transferase